MRFFGDMAARCTNDFVGTVSVICLLGTRVLDHRSRSSLVFIAATDIPVFVMEKPCAILFADMRESLLFAPRRMCGKAGVPETRLFRCEYLGGCQV